MTKLSKTATAAATSATTATIHAIHAIHAATPAINPSAFDGLADSALLREAQLVPSRKRPNATPILPFSSSTLWRRVRDGSFPAPLKLSAGITAWRVGDVRQWLNAFGVSA